MLTTKQKPAQINANYIFCGTWNISQYKYEGNVEELNVNKHRNKTKTQSISLQHANTELISALFMPALKLNSKWAVKRKLSPYLTLVVSCLSQLWSESINSLVIQNVMAC